MASMKPNGTWLERVRLPSGQRISRVFATQLEAETWGRTARSAARSGTSIPSETETLQTLKAFADASVKYIWQDSRNFHKQSQQVTLLVDLMGSERTLASLTKVDVTRARQALSERGLAGSTMNNYAATFNRLMKHAEDLGLRDTPLRMEYASLRKGRVRFLTEVEALRLQSYFSATARQDMLTLTTFLLETGARWGEASGITRGDLNLDNAKRSTATFWDTKDGGFRAVPLTLKARQAVVEALEMSPVADRPWPMAYTSFKQAFTVAVRECGMVTSGPLKVTPHTLRHTCASRMVMRGVDLRRVQMWMGHKDIKTTLIYAHLLPSDLWSAAAALEGGTGDHAGDP
jgi:integrase